MFACYQTGRPTHDAETYVAAIAATLSRFPPEIVTDATRPEGIPTKITWVPSVKEVFDYCEAEMAPVRRRQIDERIIKAQLADRQEPDRRARPTIEEMKAKYGPNWGLSSLDPIPNRETLKTPSWDEIVAMYQAEPGRITHLADAMDRLRGTK